MQQSFIAGILLILFGLISGGKPSFLWEIGEKWKSAEAKGPSDRFILICHILGGIFIIIGILMVAGLIR